MRARGAASSRSAGWVALQPRLVACLLLLLMLAQGATARRLADSSDDGVSEDGGAPVQPQAQPPGAHTQRVRVLGYGDSLTAGFHSGGRAFHPYAAPLSKHLGGCVHVDHVGASGWTTEEMVAEAAQPRASHSLTDSVGRRWDGLTAAMDAAAREGHPYSHVVLLAGTNDLARALGGGASANATEATIADAAAAIVGNLRKLWTMALDRNASVLALTVPQPAYETSVEAAAKLRAAVNKGVREEGGALTGVTVLDLDPVLPHMALPESERGRMWDDGLHLTPHGYDRLAEAIGVALLRSSPDIEAAAAAGRTPDCAAHQGAPLELPGGPRGALLRSK